MTVDHPLVLVTGLLAFVFVVWVRASRHVMVIAHEGGHAMVGFLLGRHVGRIELNRDISGTTHLTGGRLPSSIAVAVAGYLGPALWGLGGAALLSSGHVTATLWATVGLLVLCLVLVRGWFGHVSVGLVAAAVLLTGLYAPARVQEAVAYTLVWFLLLCGVPELVRLQRTRRRGRATHSDVDVLASLTVVPAVVWLGLMLVTSAAALVAGGLLLL